MDELELRAAEAAEALAEAQAALQRRADRHRRRLQAVLAPLGSDGTPEARAEALLKDNLRLFNDAERLREALGAREAELTAERDALAAVAAERDALKGKARWPWGEHTTCLLDHMEAAAATFWANYNPDDPTTAETNERVSQWLRERGVAQRTAEVMATILRADGLPTGPRK